MLESFKEEGEYDKEWENKEMKREQDRQRRKSKTSAKKQR